jgi:hypothetical protein
VVRGVGGVILELALALAWAFLAAAMVIGWARWQQYQRSCDERDKEREDS